MYEEDESVMLQGGSGRLRQEPREGSSHGNSGWLPQAEGTGSVKGLRKMQSPQGSWSTWREAETKGEREGGKKYDEERGVVEAGSGKPKLHALDMLYGDN